MSTYERIKKITDIIIEWAEQKAEDGEIEFDKTFCKDAVVRYKTSNMTLLIPNNSDGKNSGFDDNTRPDHYAYEIECLVTKLKLRLAINYQNISDETRKKCEELLEKYKMMPHDDVTPPTQFRRLCLYEYKFNDSTNEEKIREEMDKLFYQMKGYEEFICYKMDEEKKKKAE